MINRVVILRLGADMRTNALTGYNHFGREDGARLARRYIFEIGSVMSDVHGPADAASLLYSAADAVAAKVPLDDSLLKLTLKAEPVGEAASPAVVFEVEGVEQPPSWRAIGKIVWQRIWSGLTNSFLLGLVTGYCVGRAQ